MGIVLIAGGLLSLAGSGKLPGIIGAILPQSAATATTMATAMATEEAETPAPSTVPAILASADSEARREIEATSAPTAMPATSVPSATPSPASTEAPTAKPTRVLPAEGLTGAQDLLSLYSSSLASPFWDDAVFKRENGSWRLGRLASAADDRLFISPTSEIFERSFGNQAAGRLQSVEAEITLHSTNPNLGGDEAIYFGLALRSADGESSAGIQVQQADQGIISLALLQDGRANIIRQRSVSNVIARLRLELDREQSAVSAYFNDSLVGEPLDFAGDSAEVLPALFVKDGGLVGWRLGLERDAGLAAATQSL